MKHTIASGTKKKMKKRSEEKRSEEKREGGGNHKRITFEHCQKEAGSKPFLNGIVGFS